MLFMQSIRFAMKSREVENGNRSGRYNYSIPSKERKSAQMQQIRNHLFKGALYRIWCGLNRLGDSGAKVV